MCGSRMGGGEICPEKFQLDQIQNGRLATIIDFKAIHSGKMFEFNITPEAMMLGAR